MVLKLQALGLSCLPPAAIPPLGTAAPSPLVPSQGSAKWAGPWASRAGGYMTKSGPELPRQPLFGGEALEGDVLEWKGKFGWIKPLEPIDHPLASRNKSRIYVHVKDLADGLQSLTAGQRVAFQAYTDDSGIGAEALMLAECKILCNGCNFDVQKWPKDGPTAQCRHVLRGLALRQLMAWIFCASKEAFRTQERAEHGIKYTGQWKGDKRDGHGLQEWPDGARFDGQWRNGLAEGFGKFVHADGDVYEGQWRDDKANGEGVYHHADGSRYVGQWKDDQKEGQAMEEWADNSRFEGQYRAGKKHGHGTFTWPEGSSYEGEFQNNEIHGQGTYFWNDGRVYCGQWANNRMSGQGTFTWRDGRKYIGSYMHDRKDGHGVFTWPDGREYVGDWKDGKQHGIGVFKTAKGDYRRGEWKDGSRIRWISEAYREDGQQPGSPSAPNQEAAAQNTSEPPAGNAV
ncbi:PIP5K4 [Symbiodinium pilosum]|uniref:PIP5K4 protein n=1 Tax=Symbiodinium pilosum TaxID=2952 RepID=A0A812W3A5_SYMPI|nr:PIP5K4 [Symbiodinium pilosum]